jgi:hypothetical protein
VAHLYMLFTTTAASIYSVSTWDSLEECDKYSFRDALHLVTSTCFFVGRLLSYAYYLCSDSSANYLFYLIQIIHSVYLLIWWPKLLWIRIYFICMYPNTNNCYFYLFLKQRFWIFFFWKMNTDIWNPKWLYQ